MRSAAHRRHLPLICKALLVLSLTIVFVKLRYDLETGLRVHRVHQLLDGLATELGDQLELGAQYAQRPVPGAHSPWRLALVGPGDADPEGRQAQVAAPVLERAVRSLAAGTRAAVLGPFATDQADNAIAIAVAGHDADGRPRWSLAVAPVHRLMARLNLAELMRQGYRVQLANDRTGNAIFQTDDGLVGSPVTADLRFGSSRLQWRAVPRAGWQPPARFLTSTVFIVMALLLWLSYEFRHGRAWRAITLEAEEADQRRREVNVLYGKAIESVAALESRLQVVSMYDTVTGLANRSSLERRLEAALDTMRQSPAGVICLLAVGFDHVDHITHSFGAEFTSRVLVIAAERVEFVLPSKDLLFRVGEFQLAVMLPFVTPGSGEEVAATIIREVESPISLDGHNFMLHPRIGIAETGSGYSEAASLFDRANTALDAVRPNAAARYCRFDSSTSKESAHRLRLEADLGRAFEENQFDLHFEPIVVPVSNQVAGFEAHLIWCHPTEGSIAPARFLPIAIQAGMSQRLNSWVMRTAAQQAGAWRRPGREPLFVNFKLSADVFLKPDLVEELGDALAEYGIPGQCLVIELTEAALIQDISGASRLLQRLAELEVRAWLGNFGTGYSSLSYLRALPLKGVKIDRSFVERMVTDARDFGFLKSLLDLISYLGMQSIAEGVQTQEHYELLSLTACDLYQGEYFSRHMSAQQVGRWMEERSALAGGRRA